MSEDCQRMRLRKRSMMLSISSAVSARFGWHVVLQVSHSSNSMIHAMPKTRCALWMEHGFAASKRASNCHLVDAVVVAEAAVEDVDSAAEVEMAAAEGAEVEDTATDRAIVVIAQATPKCTHPLPPPPTSQPSISSPLPPILFHHHPHQPSFFKPTATKNIANPRLLDKQSPVTSSTIGEIWSGKFVMARQKVWKMVFSQLCGDNAPLYRWWCKNGPRPPITNCARVHLLFHHQTVSSSISSACVVSSLPSPWLLSTTTLPSKRSSASNQIHISPSNAQISLTVSASWRWRRRRWWWRPFSFTIPPFPFALSHPDLFDMRME